MSISKFSYIKELVNVLSKAEKRSFKLQSKRHSIQSNKGYLQLFDLIDKYPDRPEDEYLKLLEINSIQYTNIKRNLYNLILKSLRNNFSNGSLYSQLRESSDYAHILFDKGLHQQCIHFINKLIPTSKELHATVITIELTELKKKIESKFITRSRKVKNKMETLISDSDSLGHLMKTSIVLSNLCLKIQGLYIKVGYSRNIRDSQLYKAFYFSNLPQLNVLQLKIPERINWHQCHVWYHHANLNFQFSYKHAVQWVECYHHNLKLKATNTSDYLRGLQYVLVYCYHLRSKKRFNYWYKILIEYRKNSENRFSNNVKLLDYNYYYNATLNFMVVNNSYKDLDKVINEINIGKQQHKDSLDKRRYHTFNYKIACLYSYVGDYNKAIDYCNDIITDISGYLKNDISTYSRLLHILCHFRLNNFQLVDNLIDSIRSEFNSSGHANVVVDMILVFLRKACRAMNFGLDDDIIKLHIKLEAYKNDQYDKIAFIFYDYSSWCQSLLHNMSIEKAIKHLSK